MNLKKSLFVCDEMFRIYAALTFQKLRVQLDLSYTNLNEVSKEFKNKVCANTSIELDNQDEPNPLRNTSLIYSFNISQYTLLFCKVCLIKAFSIEQ